MKIRTKTIEQLLADGATFDEEGRLCKGYRWFWAISIEPEQLCLLGSEIEVEITSRCAEDIKYVDINGNYWINSEVDSVVEDEKLSEQLVDEIIDEEFEARVVKVLRKLGVV